MSCRTLRSVDDLIEGLEAAGVQLGELAFGRESNSERKEL